MPNRQHGRPSRSAADRSPGRTARTISVSRVSGTPSCVEPEVRRWPHPVDVPAAIAPDPTLHYIRCALSYQNQLLADIKALLQQLAERES